MFVLDKTSGLPYHQSKTAIHWLATLTKLEENPLGTREFWKKLFSIKTYEWMPILYNLTNFDVLWSYIVYWKLPSMKTWELQFSYVHVGAV